MKTPGSLSALIQQHIFEDDVKRNDTQQQSSKQNNLFHHTTALNTSDPKHTLTFKITGGFSGNNELDAQSGADLAPNAVLHTLRRSLRHAHDQLNFSAFVQRMIFS